MDSNLAAGGSAFVVAGVIVVVLFFILILTLRRGSGKGPAPKTPEEQFARGGGQKIASTSGWKKLGWIILVLGILFLLFFSLAPR